ncbi:uncharacterized protein RAG0_13647 [Rhynchosporium agropyri]|uniref:Uncharacterized protein n=1 Tax=Rhynchosporium agropyri TaxID=914238 RepID=A0A1E1LFX7_9HELO|nr:uncharacterized protein RAG0_13647 [Rhynchosporium agropyri]
MSGPIKSSLARTVAAIKEPNSQRSTEKFVESIAAQVPIITDTKLNGSRPHQSHDDLADPRLNQVANGHVHDGGTGHIVLLLKYKQYSIITGMEYKLRGSGTSGESSSSGKSGGFDLSLRTNKQTNYAEWWDGKNCLRPCIWYPL